MATILVIEDNAKNLKLAVFLMRKQGYEVFSAMTAEDGIAIAQAEQPDLILMDIQLPGMDGIQATQALKAHASTPPRQNSCRLKFIDPFKFEIKNESFQEAVF
jgi:two-component system cell cycle response regulator DivK